MQFTSFGGIGPVTVNTTSNGGFPVEYWAERLLEKLIQVSDSAIPEIKDQANAFKEQIRPAILFYMRQSIKSDRTTLAAKMKESGHNDVAEIIVKL
jgi:hypothetical protein